jgi:hypothetical protein
VIWPLLVVALTACTPAFRGAPPGSLNASSEDVIEVLDATARDLAACSESKCIDDIVAQRTMLIDQRYAEFVQRLRQEKTRVDFAAGISALTVALAGTLADSVAAKTNYAAAGAMLSGSNAVANQVLYYEQTVIALIAAMDANRAAARVSLKQATAGASANVADIYAALLTYERAGTFLGAITFVQASAETSRSESEGKLREVFELTELQLRKKTCITNSLLPADDLDGAKLRAASLAVGLHPEAAASADEIRLALRQFNRDALPGQIAELYAALQAQSLLGECAQTIAD